METLFYLFALGVIISGLMVILAPSPVYSVLWLIGAFVNASGLFILLEVDFIALILLIVYVGAISILFLFVIMMLNLADLIRGSRSNYLLSGLLFGGAFLFEIWIVLSLKLKGHVTWDPINFSNIEMLGRVLYTEYYYYFLLASYILLVGMIGAIVLTHEFNKEVKKQDLFLQTSRN